MCCLKRGSTYMLRWNCAAHMLEAVANLRNIEALLGNVNLPDLDVHLHLSLRHLQAVYTDKAALTWSSASPCFT